MVSSLHHLHDRKGGIAEASRVLKPNGKMVTIGECPQPIEIFPTLMNDGIRNYEGLPYTREGLEDIINDFNGKIDILPFLYTEHMEYLGYYSLIGRVANNTVIYGIKEARL